MAIGKKTGGRKKGTPNRMTAQLKDMILTALDEAHPSGGVEYLKVQARDNPTAFLTLVGKVLPMQVSGPAEDGAIIHRVELVSFGNGEN